MANERTLFERILDPGRPTPRSSRERKEQLSESIIHHLARLLNSREGCCLTADDYGMPELENTSGGKRELRQEFERAIRNTIVKHEPRLRKVRVQMERTEDERLVPRFTIEAELNVRADFSKDVSFTTVVGPSGKMKIE